MLDLIAAVDMHWGIGREGKLLYSIPEDLHRFRALTYGKSIAYGRRTLSTFPQQASLSGRINYVLSRQTDFSIEGAITIPSQEALLEIAQKEPVFLVGGASVYAALLDFCTTAHITKVFADGSADAFFPSLDEHENWVLKEQSPVYSWQDLQYCFCTYKNALL